MQWNIQVWVIRYHDLIAPLSLFPLFYLWSSFCTTTSFSLLSYFIIKWYPNFYGSLWVIQLFSMSSSNTIFLCYLSSQMSYISITTIKFADLLVQQHIDAWWWYPYPYDFHRKWKIHSSLVLDHHSFSSLFLNDSLPSISIHTLF